MIKLSDILNEIISEEIKYANPNFEYEWEEAMRYPELESLGKEGWVELAKKGNVVNYSFIKDNLGNVDLDFDNLEQVKKDRFNNAFEKGVIELPIAIKFNDNDYDLVAGNTRLSGLINKGINPKIWVVNISQLTETIQGLIGPFYHETDKENVENILKNGLQPARISNTPDSISLSPAAPSGMYGDTVLEVYLDPGQFKRAVAFTYNMIKADEFLLEKRDIELAEKLINRTITNEEYKELVNRALHNEGFLSGEIIVGEPISASQIKTELSEQSKGLWYYINRKKKLGIKSSPKNSKKYKAAVKAGEELSNEGIHDPVKPGILKNRLGKLSCTRVRSAKAKLKDKGTHYAKALQRYLNYHCND